jgi:uncharacterized protein (TIGR02996 family)
MTITDTVARLRRAILEDPDADDLRLVLADALRDSGDPRDYAEGEFVEASMKYANVGASAWFALAGIFNSLHWDDRFSLPVLLLTEPRHAVIPNRDELWCWRGLPEVWAVADVPTFEREAKDVFSRYPIRRVVLRCEVVRTLVVCGCRALCINIGTSRMAIRKRMAKMLSAKVPKDGSDICYDSPDLARADFERACVEYGRALAGLPPL